MKKVKRTIRTTVVNCLCADIERGEMENRIYRVKRCNAEKALQNAQKAEKDPNIKPVSVVGVRDEEIVASVAEEKFLEIAEITTIE